MLSALRGIDLKGSIGITAGTVYCGYVGAERRREYAMMGTSVNLSARLMSAALPDTICVDGEVFTRLGVTYRGKCYKITLLCYCLQKEKPSF